MPSTGLSPQVRSRHVETRIVIGTSPVSRRRHWTHRVTLRSSAPRIADFSNYSAAIEWSESQGRKDLFARLVLAGAMMWEMSPSLIEEDARLLHKIIDDPAQPAEYRANASALMTDLCTVRADVEGMRRYGENALEHASPPYRALALMGLLRTDEAAEVAEAAGLPLFRALFGFGRPRHSSGSTLRPPFVHSRIPRRSRPCETKLGSYVVPYRKRTGPSCSR